jgi:hypothetical protein
MGIRIRMERVGTRIGTALSCDYHASFRASGNFQEDSPSYSWILMGWSFLDLDSLSNSLAFLILYF